MSELWCFNAWGTGSETTGSGDERDAFGGSLVRSRRNRISVHCHSICGPPGGEQHRRVAAPVGSICCPGSSSRSARAPGKPSGDRSFDRQGEAGERREAKGARAHRAEEPRVDDARPRQSLQQHLDPPGENDSVRRRRGHQTRAGIDQERGDLLHERRKRSGPRERSARSTTTRQNRSPGRSAAPSAHPPLGNGRVDALSSRGPHRRGRAAASHRRSRDRDRRHRTPASVSGERAPSDRGASDDRGKHISQTVPPTPSADGTDNETTVRSLRMARR